jgi:predicted N-acetyltransferase YhbS
MTPPQPAPPSFSPIPLSDHLVLRQAGPGDLEPLVDFHQRIQGEGEWTRTLVDGDHPTTRIEDFTLVKDTHSGEIVSSMCMIPQTWSYAGLPFRVARLEMVSTDPAYRWQGLVRAQFEQLHRQCAARDIPVKVVVGRPWIYRKFGYTQALRYSACRDISRHGIPPLKEGEPEPFQVREAVPEDLPFFSQLMASARRRYLVTCLREERHWRYEFFEREVAERLQLRIIHGSSGGRPAGAIVHPHGIGDHLLDVFAWELVPEVCWPETFASTLRYLERTGEMYSRADSSRLDGFSLCLGSEHPVHGLLGDFMQREALESPFAWYVRIPDLPGFLRLIAPVLEERLARSLFAGFSGKVGTSFYGREAGLEMEFESGRLASVSTREFRWQEGALPGEHFVQLILGYRSVEELEATTAEVYLRGRTRQVLQILFPKEHSGIFPIY